MTPFKGSPYEKECLKRYDDIMNRKKSYEAEGTRLKAQLAKFGKDDLKRMIDAKKKEVEAVSKAWKEANNDPPERRYGKLLDGELKAEMADVVRLRKAADEKEKQLKAVYAKHADDCKMVYKGLGGLATVYSVLHRSAEQVLKMLEAHAKTVK